MGKQQSPPKGAAAAPGKGKVTPVQIAFLVDRYLADNGFSATLASFQNETAEIFAKTRTREAPKGLLSLADILDEYISLKEQRIVVEQEKRRVEALLGGIQDAVNAYRSGGPVNAPVLPPTEPSSPPLPPTPVMATALSGRITSANPGSISRTGSLHHQTPVTRSSPAVVPSNIPQANTISTPPDNSTCNKRKNSKLVLKAPSAPKKHRGHSQMDASTIGGNSGESHSDGSNRTDRPVHEPSPVCNLSSNKHQNPVPFVDRTSTVDISPDSDIKSTSPKTPQQTCPSQGQKSSSLGNSSCSQSATGSASKELTPSTCSIISSKTVVVSPYKRERYISVQKSCCVTSSPLKSSPRSAGKRECVKSRLDFDHSDLPLTNENPTLAGSPNSSPDDKFDDIFDFDISDFNMDFSFAELLVNVDLDCVGHAPSFELEGEARDSQLVMSQGVPDSGLLSASGGFMSQEGMLLTEGQDSVASVKTITKCIKIVSPAKVRRNSRLEPLEQPTFA